MIYQAFATPLGVFRGAADADSSSMISRWILDQAQGRGHVDDVRDLGAENLYLEQLLASCVELWLRNSPDQDFVKEQDCQVKNIWTNICHCYGPELDETGTVHMIHNDLAEGDVNAVFYASAEPARGGDLLIYGPAIQVKYSRHNVMRFQPRTGDVIVFPSWLLHRVTPYWGKDPRVSVGASFVLARPETVSGTPALYCDLD